MNLIKKSVPHTKFDGPWNLLAGKNADGVLTAETDRLSAAQLIFIRDELRAQTKLMREGNKVLCAISRKLTKKRRPRAKT